MVVKTLIYLGSGMEYDLDKIGISKISNDTKNLSKFDTNGEGNKNTGRKYAAALSTKEKKALLEYLKTL